MECASEAVAPEVRRSRRDRKDPAPARGRFLVFDGIEGAGKSTQLPRIRDWLHRTGMKTLATREPGGTPLGESLRAMLLDDRRFRGMSPVTELLIMFAARAEHLAKVIEPALAAGVWVLCDRFTDATFAYQGGGRGVDTARIAALEEAAQDGVRPDLVLVLDVPVEVGLARAGRRRAGQRGQRSIRFPAAPIEEGVASVAADRFEREDVDFFRRAREVYLERARAHPERYAIIDASAGEDTTTERVIGEISERFR